MPDHSLRAEIGATMARLRDAADSAYHGWKPAEIAQVAADGAERSLTVRSLRMAEEAWCIVPDVELAPRREALLRIPLRVPERIDGVSLRGEPLALVVNSLHPYSVAVDGATLVGEAGGEPTVAAGPVDTQVLPAITGRDAATLDLRLFPGVNDPAQNLLWFSLTTPGLRARFEVLDLAWARIHLAAELAATPAEKETVRRAAAIIPADLDGDAQTLAPLLERICDVLEPLAERAERLRVHCIGHSHIDLSYLWAWDEAARIFARDLPTFASMMEDDYPELRLTHSQPVGYEVLRSQDPAMFERVRALVASGQWEPATAQWVETDTTQPIGESLARQFAEAAWWSRQTLGVSPEVVLAPDTFGHSGNLPQLAASIGARYYYHHRANPGERVSGEMWPAYWWEGDDGTRILAVSTGHYGGSITAGKIAESARRLGLRHGHESSMLFFGVCNHGGGPTRASLDTLRRLTGARNMPEAFCSTVAAFGREIVTSPAPLPVWRGESPRLFEGCYTTRPDAKQRNRDAENALLSAEALAAVAGIDAQDDLDEGWRQTMFHQFHDIIAGTVVGEAYAKHVEDAAAACDTASRVAARALSVLHAGAAGEVVVSNPLGFERLDAVEADIAVDGPVLLRSDTGHTAWAQPTADGRVAFAARVPAFGTVAYRRVEDAQAAPPASLIVPWPHPLVDPYPSARIDDSRYLRVETDLLIAAVRRDSGIVTSLRDRRSGRELVGFGMRRGSDYFDTARSDLALGVYQVAEEDGRRHLGMSGWHLDEVASERSLLSGATVEVVEDGPVRCVLTYRHRAGDSTITTWLTFHRELPRVDYRVSVDWKERAREQAIPNLKVAFCAEIDGAAYFEVPHGVARRPAGGLEVPAVRWAAYAGEDAGFAVLNNGRSGHDALGSRLRLTLVRSAANPDLHSGIGVHETRFALLPLHGAFDAAAVTREAASFNQPLLARDAATDSSAPTSAPLQPALSGDGSVVIAAFKRARDGRGRVLRLVEERGVAASVRIGSLPAAAAVWECDLSERRLRTLAVSDGCVEVQLHPHQVCTVLVEEPA